jgi:(p)ppGpp synthase/HD superfamily hydrolase
MLSVCVDQVLREYGEGKLSDLITRAHTFATSAHAGQKRKYTGENYITHPEAVAALVSTRLHTPEMIAAALRHDVVEDTGETIEGIRLWFGDTVADLVDQLTDVSRPKDGNRAVRKALDRDRLAKASPEAKTIKLADLIDNTRSIVQHDPGFAKVYMAEKAALLEVLKEGDSVLWAMAKEFVDA